MDAARKSEFIDNYLESFRQQLQGDVSKMPEEWDGHEIRQLLADRVTHEIHKPTMTGKRLRAFRQIVAEKNL